MKPWSALLALLVSVGLSSAAAAQDMTTVGDWRYLGETSATTFAWDLGSERPLGDDLVVRMMSSPLHPSGGASAVEFEVQEVWVNCARRDYVIAYQQAFAADGRAISRVTPPRARTRPSLEMRNIAGTPVEVFFPFVCEGREPPERQEPGEAALMAREARSYVLSGTAEWERRKPPAP